MRRSLELLSPRDRRYLFAALGIQVSLSALDVLGILLIGLVGALSVAASQGTNPPAVLTNVLEILGFSSLSDSELLLVCAGSAAFILLAKSLFSAMLTRRVLFFLANRQAVLTGRLSKLLFDQPLTTLQARSSQETAFALLSGSGAATLQILGQSLLVATELALLIAVAVTLIWVNPIVAIASICFFALVGAGLQAVLGRRAASIGALSADTEIRSLQAIQEALGAYREMTVTGRRSAYVRRIEQLRYIAARMIAEGQFIGIFPKYLFEVALVVGGLVLAGFLFSTQPFEAAVAQFAIFIAAATRVMPSILRLQGATLSLRGAASVAVHAFDLASSLERSDSQFASVDFTERNSKDLNANQFRADIEVRNLTFRYPNQPRAALHDVDFFIASGERLAIVGRSGAGKSTLADVILGILKPTAGSVRIGGVSPAQAIEKWPGIIGYVPQSVLLANCSILENVGLGIDHDQIREGQVWEALRRAQISDIAENSPDGLKTVIGEGGFRLSGGQRQRLGIARALYGRPQLLVLDEATSSLDVETEATIGATLAQLEGVITTITIAHRLSTIRSATRLIYLANGNLRAVGTFEELRESIPEFREQLRLSNIG